MGNVSNRYEIEKEDRINSFLSIKTAKHTNKLHNFLGEDKTKNYLNKLYSTALDKVNPSVVKIDKNKSFQSEEECFNEISEYFKLCYDNNIVPSVANMAVFLGLSRETIYSLIANRGSCSDILQQAVNLCHSIIELGSIEGYVSPVLYIFLSKNYHGMQDSSTINLTSTVDSTPNTSETINALKEQIALEKNQNNF